MSMVDALLVMLFIAYKWLKWGISWCCRCQKTHIFFLLIKVPINIAARQKKEFPRESGYWYRDVRNSTWIML